METPPSLLLPPIMPLLGPHNHTRAASRTSEASSFNAAARIPLIGSVIGGERQPLQRGPPQAVDTYVWSAHRCRFLPSCLNLITGRLEQVRPVPLHGATGCSHAYLGRRIGMGSGNPSLYESARYGEAAHSLGFCERLQTQRETYAIAVVSHRCFGLIVLAPRQLQVSDLGNAHTRQLRPGQHETSVLLSANAQAIHKRAVFRTESACLRITLKARTVAPTEAREPRVQLVEVDVSVAAEGGAIATIVEEPL